MMHNIILFITLLTGCTTIKYQDGTATFTRTSFGTQLQITELNASTDEHGNRTIKLIGYVSDQVQAMEKIAEGAARGAASAIKP